MAAAGGGEVIRSRGGGKRSEVKVGTRRVQAVKRDRNASFQESGEARHDHRSIIRASRVYVQSES